ncbi:precorrin-8X methylmutase [Eubacteriales bacterium OttesenSCG-928-A19]|nr:precorrin-8X methylmutase [Eubacteriales bacterium OttesenSCG-928-A19]
MLNIRPEDIERRSMAIIDAELAEAGIALEAANRHVIKRAIHASADLDYARTLRFTPDAVRLGVAALTAGATIVTDTQMALSGISKPVLDGLGCEAHCFIADREVARLAKVRGETRSAVSMDMAAEVPGPLLLAIGNAPTALIRLRALIDAGRIRPALIVGVPVGFVNVVESKELIAASGVPSILAMGRKGGSNIAAAIVNALLYEAAGREQW